MENRSVVDRGSKESQHTDTGRETQEFPPGGEILFILKWWGYTRLQVKTTEKDTHRKTVGTEEGLSSVASLGFPGGSAVKNPPAMQEMQV